MMVLPYLVDTPLDDEGLEGMSSAGRSIAMQDEKSYKVKSPH
jgi:hypothetical protein